MRIFFLVKLSLMVSVMMVQAAGATCVQVALLGDDGKILTPPGLVVGLKVGEAVIFNTPLPPYREQKEIRNVRCPNELEVSIVELYNRSCISDRARQQTAVDNAADIYAILQRCADLQEALGVSN